MTINTRTATTDDLDQITRLVETYDRIYGINSVDSGLRDVHLAAIRHGIDKLYNLRTIVATDDDGAVVGVCVQQFLGSVWILRITYISAAGNKFNASRVGGPMMDDMCKHAESLGYFVFYYVVRDSGTKRLDMTLSNAEHLRTQYTIEDIEFIAPMTASTDENVRKYITGVTTGKNLKPLVVRKCVRNE